MGLLLLPLLLQPALLLLVLQLGIALILLWRCGGGGAAVANLSEPPICFTGW